MKSQIISVIPPEKRHSKVFYALCTSGERDENGHYTMHYTPIRNARTFENSFGLDLVKFDGKISEGKTGMTVNSYHKTRENFELWLTTFGIEKLNKLIDEAVEKYGKSPRYTRPNEKSSDVFHKNDDGSWSVAV